MQVHRINGSESPQGFVFCTKKGTPYDRKNLIDREFIPALKRAGLRRIRFHDLRHTCATLLIAQGENPKVVQNYLGHASAQTTLDRYGPLMPQTSQEAAKKLDVMIFWSNGANGAQTEQPEIPSIQVS